MADLLGYGLSFGCGVVATVLVFQVRSLLHEWREFAERAARDERRDREHGIGQADRG